MRIHQFPWLLLIFLLLILSQAKTIHTQCLNDQRSLLIQLNNSLITSLPLISNTTKSKLKSWNLNKDCCSWDGVDCDKVGHVTSLDLSTEFISSGLDNSSSLFKLQYLQRLNLAFNTINSSSIPSGFSQLRSLNYLNLSNSGFSGQIPIEISFLTRLVTLDLSSFSPGTNSLMLINPDLRNLTSNLVELIELRLDGVNISAHGTNWGQALSSSVPKLKVLSLVNCYLSGPFDQSLLKLNSLHELRVDQNNISAEVPDFFGQFSNLTSLHLSSCGLFGKLPDKILQIKTLETLYLSNNKLLNGSLPEFPKNGSLQTLVLTETSFSGEIPSSIGNLRLLSRLELMNCRFNGSIPTSMGNLTQLSYLRLSSNSFSGSIPSIRWSENLVQIDLSHNSLVGPIPSQWNKLVKLNTLNLKNNSLNGTISSGLFTLPSIQKLDFSLNQFSGRLSEFNTTSSSLLDTLDLSINKLEGAIPNSIFGLSNLKILILSSNKFNGTTILDKFLEKFRSLSNLDLSSNNLSISTGGSGGNSTIFPQIGSLKLRSCNLREFPMFLQNQTRLLSQLDLSDNQIRGKVPNWIWKIGSGSLTQLNLSHNHLEDPDLPLPNNSFKGLALLDLHSNKFRGKNFVLPPSLAVLDYSDNNLTSIPTNISAYLSASIFVSLSKNTISGEIPVTICEAACSIQVLDLSNNNLSGSIPECLGTIKTLRVLNLGGNSFSGTMPQVFPGQGSCSLRTLTLNRNKLKGDVPRSLASCKMLEVLDLGNNQMSGNFPSWLGEMHSLRVLVLRSNKFGGVLGHQGTNNNFRTLQIIDIASNNFTGTLSGDHFSNFKSMVTSEQEEQSKRKHGILKFRFLEFSELYYQDTVTVTSKGLEMELVKILTIFSSIDLSNNGFAGEIPETIGNLESLYVLNLSHNALTGHIPSSIGKLKDLESLDLSSNMLTGEIPVELADLSFLSVLNLSFNKLVGRIPPGQQLRTFMAASFEGNDGLCGPPLSKCSNITMATNMASYSKDEADWQFIVTGLGFGGGLGMVLAALVFWKKGRKWYDDHINRIFSIILPVRLFRVSCDDGRVDVEETTKDERKENRGETNVDDEEENEEGLLGHYCVFCTKLDITMRRVIHNPNCNCHS